MPLLQIEIERGPGTDREIETAVRIALGSIGGLSVNSMRVMPGPPTTESIPIEWDSDNYLAFSVRGVTFEQNARIEEIELKENERFFKALSSREKEDIAADSAIGFTLNWASSTAEMAENCRRAAEWLAVVASCFPGCVVTTNID